MTELPINSADYWNKRFREDWEAHGGPEQSRYFAGLAIGLMPGWLRGRAAGLDWCDFGCAQGDGTAALADGLGAPVAGVDVAVEGIEAASSRYPSLRFEAVDWMASPPPPSPSVDVVFSSNTLEHFPDPSAVLARMEARARRAVVALVPFRERELIDEHHVSFDPASLPAALPGGFMLVHLRVRDVRAHEPCYWPGEQALVVWADPTWLAGIGVTAAALELRVDAEPALADLRERLERTVDGLATRIEAASDADPVLEQARATLKRWAWLRGQGAGIAAEADRSRLQAEIDEAERALRLIAPGLLREEAVAMLSARLASLEQALSEAGAALGDAQQALAAERAATRAAADAAGARLDGQAAQIAALQARLESEGAARAQLDAELALARGTLATIPRLEELLSSVRAELEATHRSLAEAQRQRDGCIDDAIREAARAAAAVEAHAIAERRIAQLEAESVARLAEMVARARADEGALATARAGIGALEDARRVLEAEVSTMAARMAEAEARSAQVLAASEQAAAVAVEASAQRIAAMQARCDGLEASLAAEREQVASAEARLAAAEAAIREREASAARHADALEARIRELDARASAAATAQAAEAVARRRDLEAHDATRAALAALEAEREALASALEAGARAQRQGQFDIAFRDAALHGVRQRVSELEAQLALVLGSRSWRITRPLRAAARLVRRWRGGTAPATPAIARTSVPVVLPPPAPASARAGAIAAGATAPRALAAGDPPPLAKGVIHLVEHFVSGGLERVALDLAERMARAGRPVVIAVAGDAGPIADEAMAHGLEVVRLGQDPEALAALVARMGGPTLVAHHCYLGWREARRAGADILEVLHNAYHWQRGVDVLDVLRRDTGARFAAVSRWVRDYATSHLGLAPDRVALVNNGLNRAGFLRPPPGLMARARQASVAEAPRLLFMANLQLQKNHLLVIAAFARLVEDHPGARLVMAGMLQGDPAMVEAVRRAAAPLVASGHLALAGPLDRRALSRELAIAHVALLPTQYEGFSIATLEFAYFGLPSVLSRTGAAVELAERYGHVVLCEDVALGADDLASDEVQARFFAPSEASIEALRGAMAEALAEYPRLLDAASDVAADYRSYDIEAVAERYGALVEGGGV